jgi:hypothetical protein
VRELLVDFFAAQERVAWLLDDRTDEAEAVGDSPGFFDFRSEPFGCSPVEGFARVDEVIEGADGLFDGGVAVWAVGVEDVDVV